MQEMYGTAGSRLEEVYTLDDSKKWKNVLRMVEWFRLTEEEKDDILELMAKRDRLRKRKKRGPNPRSSQGASSGALPQQELQLVTLVQIVIVDPRILRFVIMVRVQTNPKKMFH